MKKYSFFIVLSLFSVWVFSNENYQCDAVDDDLTGLVCISSDKKYSTVSKLTQLGSTYNASITFPDDGDTWEVEVNQSNIKISMNDDESFFGKIKNKRIFGTLVRKNFSRTDAELVGSGMTGEADIFYDNGDTFKGRIKDNLREGLGVYTFALLDGQENPEFTECIYKEDECQTGKYYFDTGTTYQGDFEDGFFHGEGVYRYNHGAIYTGTFAYDSRRGYGEYFYEEGSKLSHYKGYYIDNKQHGPGETMWSGDGIPGYGDRLIKYHVGQYKDGEMTGQGVFLDFEKRIIYQGNLLEGSRHGAGTTFLQDEEGRLFSHSGNYKDDLLNGFGKIHYSDGATFEGNYSEGQRSGLGVLIDPIISTVSTGIFSNGELNGMGKEEVFNADGSSAFVLEINFLNGEKHGRGLVTFNDGSTFYARYIDGEYQGELEELQDPPVPINDRLALVIGNDNYLSSPLNNAVSDSIGISDQLKKSGFEVIYVSNATYELFQKAISEFRNRLELMGPTTTALFYYAGHAAQVDGINYLNPIDSEISSKFELYTKAINMNDIFSVVSEHVDRVKIVILDACRNNPYPSFIRSASTGLAQMTAPDGTIIGYSTSPGKVSLDGEINGYGIYTGNLISAMNVPGRTIEEVFKETTRAVKTLTNNKQVPYTSTTLSGNFYFIED